MKKFNDVRYPGHGTIIAESECVCGHYIRDHDRRWDLDSVKDISSRYYDWLPCRQCLCEQFITIYYKSLRYSNDDVSVRYTSVPHLRQEFMKSGETNMRTEHGSVIGPQDPNHQQTRTTATRIKDAVINNPSYSKGSVEQVTQEQKENIISKMIRLEQNLGGLAPGLLDMYCAGIEPYEIEAVQEDLVSMYGEDWDTKGPVKSKELAVMAA
jgi:hypothetical protein